MRSRWSRRVTLGIVSALTATFAFVGFVEGPAGAATIAQSAPTSGTVTTTASSGFHSQLVTSPAATIYAEASSGAYTQVFVSSSGAVSTSGTLPAGPYTVTGTDLDAGADSGNWTFTLTVTPVPIIQSAPTSGTVTTTASNTYHNQLVTSPAATVYTETSSGAYTQVLVTPSGAVSTSGTLPAGPYTVSGTDADSSGDTQGTWAFTLTVTAVTITQSAPTTDTVASTASRPTQTSW